MKYSNNKEINKQVHMLVKMGWMPVKKSRHWQVKSPSGKTLTVPNTPSDGRAVLNFMGDLKRSS